MAETNVTCRFCGKPIAKATAYNPTPRMYYCDVSCYDGSKAKTTRQYKPKYGSIRRELTDYIQQIYIDAGIDKTTISWNTISKQLENILLDNPSWSDETIIYILKYMYEINQMELITDANPNPLALVPYYGKEAEAYFYERQQLEQCIANFVMDDEPIVVKKANTIPKINQLKILDITSVV